MEIAYYENMTNAMKKVAEIITNEDYAKQEFLYCHEQYLKAKEAGNIKLPHTTEDGKPVLHGARLQIYAIEEYWEIRRDSIKQFLPREWVEEQGVSSIVYKCH